MNATIKQQILTHKIVAIIRGIGEDMIIPTAEALYNGGIHCLEITLNTPHALRMIEQVKDCYADRLLIGAGTVLDGASTINAITAGADFILSPILSYDIIETCHRYSKTVVPGIATPTEAFHAWNAGADIVKIFPAASLGTSYIKNLKGPLNNIDIMAVGGINLGNISDFHLAGSHCFGIGSDLANTALIKNNDFDAITRLAKDYVNALLL